jgi:hypothetical protein
MKIIAQFLHETGACPEDLKLFKRTFPRGCVLNKRNLRIALNKGLGILWFVEHFLHDPDMAEDLKDWAETFSHSRKPQDEYDRCSCGACKLNNREWVRKAGKTATPKQIRDLNRIFKLEKR